MNLDEAIQFMTNEIVLILSCNKPTIYLYGSVVLDDFKLGWSDIDILVLTESEITEEQASKLVNLRKYAGAISATHIFACLREVCSRWTHF